MTNALDVLQNAIEERLEKLAAYGEPDSLYHKIYWSLLDKGGKLDTCPDKIRQAFNLLEDVKDYMYRIYQATYNVFIRRFWKDGPDGRLEPHLGKKTYLAKGVPYQRAVFLANEYNKAHRPGRYSLKAEFTIDR